MSMTEFIFLNMTEVQVMTLCVIAVVAFLVAVTAFLYLSDAFFNWMRLRRALQEEEEP